MLPQGLMESRKHDAVQNKTRIYTDFADDFRRANKDTICLMEYYVSIDNELKYFKI